MTQRVAIGDLVERLNERTPDPVADGFEFFVGVDDLDADDLTLRRWGLIEDGDLPPTFRYVFPPGAVLFPTRRPALRKCAVAPFAGITGEKILVLQTKDALRLDPSFMPFLLGSEGVRGWVIAKAIGSVTPHFRWRDLAGYEVALPPLEEQRRVAAALAAADAVSDRLGRLTTAIERALDSYAHSAFSRARWPERTLGELLEYASDGPFGSKIKTEHYTSSGARVIRLNNIDINRFNDQDRVFIGMDYFESSLKGHAVMPGDVVVAGLGDASIPAGRACVVPDHLGPAVNKADCFCLRPGEHLDARFLAFFLSSRSGLSQSAAFSQGSTRSRLNLTNIKRMTLPVPPMGAQEEMVGQLASLLRAADLADARQRHADAMRAVLSRRLFEGTGVI